MDQYAPAPIEVAISIAAPPEAAWAALTDPRAALAWLGALKFKPELGHLFFVQPNPLKRAMRSRSGAIHCEMLELVPSERMTISWFRPGAPATTAMITLAPGADGVDVRVIHDGWEQFPPQVVTRLRAAIADEWTRRILPALRIEAVKRVAAPIGAHEAS